MRSRARALACRLARSFLRWGLARCFKLFSVIPFLSCPLNCNHGGCVGVSRGAAGFAPSRALASLRREPAAPREVLVAPTGLSFLSAGAVCKNSRARLSARVLVPTITQII